MEAWNIKSIVASLFSSGLGEELYPGTSMPAPNATTVAEREPWKGIFRDELSALDRIRAYEHAGLVDGDGLADAPEGELGIRDEEDGVYRCLDCLHEIWDGACSHCERIYPAHLDFDFNDILGAEDDIDIDMESLDGGDHDGVHGLAVQVEGEDDGYESSFIDDDDNNGNALIDVIAELGRNARNERRPRAESVISISSGDGSDGQAVDVGSGDDNEETNTEDEEGEDEDEEDVAVPGPARRGRTRRGPFVPSDDETEEDEDDSGDEFLTRRRNRPLHPPAYDDEDEDERTSEDE